MVGLIDSAARIVALAALVPLVCGSVLPRALEVGQTWEEYDQTSSAFAQQGVCGRYLDTPTRPGVDELWPCRQYCKGHEDDVGCSADNSGGLSTYSKKPDGQ